MKSSALLFLAGLCLIQALPVFVATYQKPNGGIVAYDLGSNGVLAPLATSSAQSPSWVSLHPNLRFLYSTVEADRGSFQSWRVNSDSSLTLLNTVASKGSYPAHLSVHPSGNYLLGTNYGTGNFLVYQLNGDGSLNPEPLYNVRPGRGQNPHAHQMFTAPNGDIVGVDLGSDQIFVWRFRGSNLELKQTVDLAAGSGPRHAEFGPNNVVYVLNELANTIVYFKVDSDTGIWTRMNEKSTLAPGSAKSSSAEIKISPNGRFLYATNRGADDIAIFSIDRKSGELSAVGRQSSGASWPRGLSIDPSGNWMLVGNQYGNAVVTYRIGEDGMLQ